MRWLIRKKHNQDEARMKVPPRIILSESGVLVS